MSSTRRFKSTTSRKAQEDPRFRATLEAVAHTDLLDHLASKKVREVKLVAKTSGQAKYLSFLQDDDVDVTVGTGPAGTGKTYMAILSSIKDLREGKCERIVLTRPIVTVDDEEIGHLPGDINEKLAPWTRPMLDVFKEVYHPKMVAKMIEDEVIELSPLGFMRGRTFKNCRVILDEAQNATPEHLKMLLTRIGQGTRMVITGDIEQTDRKSSQNGLMDLRNRLVKASGVAGIALCEFTAKDVQRHRLIPSILQLYK